MRDSAFMHESEPPFPLKPIKQICLVGWNTDNTELIDLKKNICLRKT